MKWVLLDGSPRGRQSNTSLLLDRLGRGLAAAGHTWELLHLAISSHRAAAPERFAAAERFVLGFPLYTDAMPGQVMELIERLAPYEGRQENPPLAFLVQSGMPEAGQSRPLERYLELLAARLGSRYLGTIIKGSVEGIRVMPSWVARRILDRVEWLGRDLGTHDRLDPVALRRFAGPDRHTGWRAPLLRLTFSVIQSPFWNRRLRANAAFEERFARPFAPPPW